MPEPHFVTEELVAHWTGRPASTIRRWGSEGRITRYEEHGLRKNGVRYNLMEIDPATRDSDGNLTPTPAPPLPGRVRIGNAA